MGRGLPWQGDQEVWAQLLHSSQRPQSAPTFTPEDPPAPTNEWAGRTRGIFGAGAVLEFWVWLPSRRRKWTCGSLAATDRTQG